MSDKPAIVAWAADVVSAEVEALMHLNEEMQAFCLHRFVVSEKDRTITCSKCKRPFDPFDAMMFLSREWRRYTENLELLRKDNERLGTLRRALMKTVQSLKAQVRRRGGTP